MSAKKENLLLLMERPLEPAFISKTKGTKTAAFDVPGDYLLDKYKPLQVPLASRFGNDVDEMIPVKNITIPPLGEILDLPRESNFSLFLPKHRKIAGQLIDIFLGMRNIDDLQSAAVFARDRVNPYLFNYALSVALLHRDDTQDLDLPSFISTFPDKYVEAKIFKKVREEVIVAPKESRMPIEIPRDYTASDLEFEHRLAYFREDLGANLHHWHWHLVYPTSGARKVVDKNRRGELFYYMHQQLIARYNFERLCNKLKRVKRLNNWQEPIKEGYFPKLDSLVASRSYPGRVANLKLQGVKRPVEGFEFDVDDLGRWRDRILDAIHTGTARKANGDKIQLTENEGIDILGNIIEASTVLSPDYDFYGDFHNVGHILLAFIHDPDNRHLEQFGVMGDVATAMRDPVFYRWHAYIDDLFQEYKATLPRYTENQLNYPGITVTGVSIETEGSPKNVFNTLWQQADIDLSRGMDFLEKDPTFVRFTHLQHQPFSYNIKIDNKSGGNKKGTCRIFLGPKHDERGNPWLFRDQRTLFIELDKFTVNLKQGENTIRQASTQSSVTIPFERTFRDLNLNRPPTGAALEEFNFCGCGWPQHLLIPKGTPEGFPCDLFVMVSNFDDDKIEQDTTGTCNDAGSYCGIRDKLYPDRRSMGYPFDRMPRDGADTLPQFLTPNMRVQEVNIKFSNMTIRPKSRS